MTPEDYERAVRLLSLTALAAGLGAKDPVDLATRAQQRFAHSQIDPNTLRYVVSWMRAQIDREKAEAIEAKDRRIQAAYEDAMRDQY